MIITLHYSLVSYLAPAPLTFQNHAGQFSSGLANTGAVCSEDTKSADMDLKGIILQRLILFSVALRALLYAYCLSPGLGSSNF